MYCADNQYTYIHANETTYVTSNSCLLLDSTIKVDCITVNTLPAKTAVDDHIQQLLDALLSSLRRSISSNAQVDVFLIKKAFL